MKILACNINTPVYKSVTSSQYKAKNTSTSYQNTNASLAKDPARYLSSPDYIYFTGSKKPNKVDKCKLPSIKSPNADVATKFVQNIYREFKKLEPDEQTSNKLECMVSDHLKKFLEDNNIKNVEVLPLKDEKQYSTESTQGGFLERYDEDNKPAGGTLYLDNFKYNIEDEKNIFRYLSIVGHEVTHLLQHRNNADVLSNLDKDSADKLRGLTTYFAGCHEDYIMNSAIQNYIDTCYDMVKYDENKKEKTGQILERFIEDIDKYGFIYSEKDIVTIIGDKTINLNRVVKESFDEKYIADLFNDMDTFIDSPLAKKCKDKLLETMDKEEIKRLLLLNYCQHLDREKEAYVANYKLWKKEKGINDNVTTMMELIPGAFQAQCKILKNKTTTEQ